MLIHLPGQACVLHALVLLTGPSQASPPYKGFGLVQERVETWLPPPQLFEHLLKSDHLVNPPSTR